MTAYEIKQDGQLYMNGSFLLSYKTSASPTFSMRQITTKAAMEGKSTLPPNVLIAFKES